jgi:putative transposase
MASEEAKVHVRDAMARVRDFHPYRHLAHVLLDDHLHWIVAPAASTHVAKLVGSLKRDLSLHRGPISAVDKLWQPRYYDHVVRDEADLRRHLDYVHYNPVRHGYVSFAADCTWSSLQAWVRRGYYTLDWGCEEPIGIHVSNPE